MSLVSEGAGVTYPAADVAFAHRCEPSIATAVIILHSSSCSLLIEAGFLHYAT